MARSWRDVRAEAVASGRVDPARVDAARRRMKAMEHAHTLAKKHIVDVFPWVMFLSREEVREFVVELVATLRAAESLDNPAPVVQVIEAWRHTAEVLADPELAALLVTGTDEDHGPVPAPGPA